MHAPHVPYTHTHKICHIYDAINIVPGFIRIPLNTWGLSDSFRIFPHTVGLSDFFRYRGFKKNQINPGYWGSNFSSPPMWTCPDGARLLRRVAPRCRAPHFTTRVFGHSAISPFLGGLFLISMHIHLYLHHAPHVPCTQTNGICHTYDE